MKQSHKQSSEHQQLEHYLFKHYQLKTKSLTSIHAFQDQNFVVLTKENEKYFCKISPLKSLEMVQNSNQILNYLSNQKMPLSIPQMILSHSKQDFTEVQFGDNINQIRLFTYLGGKQALGLKREWEISDICLIAQKCAVLSSKLNSIKLPYNKRQFDYDLKHSNTAIKKFREKTNYSLPKYQHYLQIFEKQVLQKLDHFPQFLIHNDLNPANILISEFEGQLHISVVDFDDVIESARVFQVVKFIFFFRILLPQLELPLFISSILKAWEKVIPLSDFQKQRIPLILTQQALFNSISSHYYSALYPENKKYFMLWEETGLSVLDEVSELHPDKLDYQLQ